MFFRIQILGVFFICGAASVLAQPATSQTKPRSHVERFATAEMRAEKAEAETAAKLAVNPNDAETLNARALARMRLGKYAEAADDLRRAVNLSAKNSEYQANLGYALWKLGKPEDAVKAERAALAAELAAVREAVRHFIAVEYPGGTTHPADEDADLLARAVLDGEAKG